MKGQEFKDQWCADGDLLYTLNIKEVDPFTLTEESIDFLTSIGLPKDAAPFLSFEIGKVDSSVLQLTKVYPHLPKKYDQYLNIGSDGEGNPIAIDMSNSDTIVLLDHENNFSPSLMNSSITKMAFCLLHYKRFVLKVNEEFGEDAFFDSNFSNEQFEELRSNLSATDPDALIEDLFWWQELEELLSNREYYQNNN